MSHEAKVTSSNLSFPLSLGPIACIKKKKIKIVENEFRMKKMLTVGPVILHIHGGKKNMLIIRENHA